MEKFNELYNLIFQSFWHWIGTILLLQVLSNGIAICFTGMGNFFKGFITIKENRKK